MSKQIAVILRNRQAEALRMSIGLILMDDTVDIFILNNHLDRSDKTALNIETIQEMQMNIYSNVVQGDEVAYLATAAMADKLLTYDHVLAY
ncbi:MAG: hypothetical protein OEY11_05200 [Gammaproteobacteria bacterium]|nr:hypothetical protein [Gammaproteobacteria bacterium]